MCYSYLLNNIIVSINPNQQARVLLCLSHLFSELSEWIWQFSTVVWLTSLGGSHEDGSGISSSVGTLGSSLFLNSAYQATVQMFVILLVGRITKDVGANHARLNRKQFVSFVILSQIPCILIATLVLGKEIRNLRWQQSVDGNHDDSVMQDVGRDRGEHRAPSRATAVLRLIAIFVSGGLSQILKLSYDISLERDWMVNISGSDDSGRWLVMTNVILKQIHLICVIVGPSIAVVLHSRNGTSSVLWVGCIKIVSLIMMNVLISRTYRIIPSLRNHEERISSSRDIDPDELDGQPSQESDEPPETFAAVSSSSSCSSVDNFRVYFSQEVAWAGIALAFLYANVMTFGGMLVAYLTSLGMDWSVIGACQGASNFFGLLGTCAFAVSQRYLDVRRTAMWGLCWQFLFLTLSISSVMVYRGNGLLAAKLVIVGVVLSRVGLYVFFLSCTQLYQQTVCCEKRGQVGGTQTTLNSLFEVVPFILGMIYSDVDDYWIVMLVSYVSVGMAALIVVFGAEQRCRRSYTIISSTTRDEIMTAGSDVDTDSLPGNDRTGLQEMCQLATIETERKRCEQVGETEMSTASPVDKII